MIKFMFCAYKLVNKLFRYGLSHFFIIRQSSIFYLVAVATHSIDSFIRNTHFLKFMN